MNAKTLAEAALSGVALIAVAAFVLTRPSFDLSPDPADPATGGTTQQTDGTPSTSEGDQTTAPTTSVVAPDDTARLAGIDVSHYQGNVDWSTAKGTGIAFAYAKATDGLTYTDPKFAGNQKSTTAEGLPFGAYHFFEPKDDAVAQAKHYLSVAKVGAGWLPPVLDLERSPGSSDPATIAEGAKQWLEYVEGATGCTPMIYASPSYYNSYLGVAFNKYPLWLADYASRAKLPTGVAVWQIWQHSQKGRIDGVSGSVDLDWFAGDTAALDAFKCGTGN